MTIIKVKCTDQVLTFENTPIIASGGLEEDFVQFSFCSKWDGYARTAVFWRTEADAYHVVLDENDGGQIPPEVTDQEGLIYFGVFGVNADGHRRTSEVLTYRIVKGAITTGTKPSEPTQEIYTQLLADYAEVMNNLATFNEAVQASAAAATAAQTAAETAQGQVASAENAAGAAQTAAGEAQSQATAAASAASAAQTAAENAAASAAAAAPAVHASQHKTGGSDPLTASDVGARPDTWVPTAEDVGARPDTWLPTIDAIGAAPAGRGLGTEWGAPAPTNDEGLLDANLISGSGFYRACANTHNSDWNAILHIQYNADRATQFAFNRYNSYSGSMQTKREKYDGVWSEWEWINPYMSANSEFRTIERYLGKAVYKKVDANGVAMWRLDGETTWRVDIMGVTASTTDITAGSSALATGAQYLVYE